MLGIRESERVPAILRKRTDYAAYVRDNPRTEYEMKRQATMVGIGVFLDLDIAG